MNRLYDTMGTSKQAFHQYHNRQLVDMEEEAYLLELVKQIREDHPTMGCRDMYFKIAPSNIGRDAFEELCKQNGLASNRVKNYHRTTDSSGVIRFPNLAENVKLTGPDQLWVSDITYYEVDGRFNYLTFVLDAFTKRILGLSVSKRLFTEDTTLPALTKAIKTRGKEKLTGLIFHSDGGDQYFDKNFIALTKSYDIQNSMCTYPWENPFAERINGVIKNNYLKHWDIKDSSDLKQSVDRAVKLYNTDKPHKSLHRLTPIQFEQTIFEAGRKIQDEVVHPNGEKENHLQVPETSKIRKVSNVKQYPKTVNVI